MSSQTMSPPKQSHTQDTEGQRQTSKTPKQNGGIQQNIGTIDRYVRLTAGLFLVGSAMSSRKQGLGSKALLAFGAMSATEGILGWCPLMHLLGVKDMTGALETGKSNQSKGNSQTQGDRQPDGRGDTERHESDQIAAKTKCSRSRCLTAVGWLFCHSL